MFSLFRAGRLPPSSKNEGESGHPKREIYAERIGDQEKRMVSIYKPARQVTATSQAR